MTIKTGDRLPDTTFMTMGDNGPEAVPSAEFFAGRRIALFSVPGAFTPTCSARHLPGFIDNADAIKAKGVDEIACTAVNDVFVMGAWGKANDADGKVKMLADGSANFVKALGLTLDLTEKGLGVRGQRFSMLVNDGVVEQLHVEEGGAFEVSSAEYLLERL